MTRFVHVLQIRVSHLGHRPTNTDVPRFHGRTGYDKAQIAHSRIRTPSSTVATEQPRRATTLAHNRVVSSAAFIRLAARVRASSGVRLTVIRMLSPRPTGSTIALPGSTATPHQASMGCSRERSSPT